MYFYQEILINNFYFLIEIVKFWEMHDALGCLNGMLPELNDTFDTVMIPLSAPSCNCPPKHTAGMENSCYLCV